MAVEGAQEDIAVRRGGGEPDDTAEHVDFFDAIRVIEAAHFSAAEFLKNQAGVRLLRFHRVVGRNRGERGQEARGNAFERVRPGRGADGTFDLVPHIGWRFRDNAGVHRFHDGNFGRKALREQMQPGRK